MTYIDIDKSLIIPKADNPEPKEPKRMLEVSTLPDGRRHIVINASSLGNMQSCWQKAEYSLHRKLKGPEGPATQFGSAIHKAMEVYYSAPISERVIPKNYTEDMELMGHGAQLDNESEFLLYRATRAFINCAAPLANLPDGDKRSIANGVWILSHYFKTYINDPYEVYIDESGPLIERHLEMEIYKDLSMTVSIHGTIDAVLKNTANGSVIVCDHKTTSVVGNQFYNRLKPNHQYTCYTWLAQELLGVKSDKFMVNALQVKPKPKTTRGTLPHFPRQITTRSESDIAEFRKVVIHYATQYLACLDNDYWPRGHVDSCAMYSGCQFLGICSAPAKIRENIISASYGGNNA